MKMQADDGPLYLFTFDGQGKHSGKQPIADMNECTAIIGRAVCEKQTVTITDADDFCVFRCENGRIVWPRITDLYPKINLDAGG